MLLPTTYLAALLFLVLSALCWGSWANTLKLARKWRFELFYYDYSFGVLLCAILAAFTLGSMNAQELTFQDNFLIAGYRKMAYCFASGTVFNLANLMLLAAMSVAGMAISFPIAFGLALMIDALWSYASHPQGSLMVLTGGAVLLVASTITNGFAHTARIDAQAEAAKTAFQADPRGKRPPRPMGAARGIVLSVLSGMLMSLFTPLLDLGRLGDNGVAPYGAVLLFAVGMFLSTLFFVPFFTNFPVLGGAIPITHYFRGTKQQHVWGLAGGVIWAVGAIAQFAAIAAPVSDQLQPWLIPAFGPAAGLLGALWGLTAWQEFKGADDRTRMLLVMTLVLFVAGVSMTSIGPVSGSK